MTGSGGALFAAVFLACVVEAVEALTIVLAAGTARDWRSAGFGVGSALVVLAVVGFVPCADKHRVKEASWQRFV